MDYKKRGNKYLPRKSQANTTIGGVPMVYGLDNSLLNLYASYLLSSNKSVHRYTVNNMRKLMFTINESSFNDQYLILKFHFIRNALEAKEKGLNKDLLISDVSRKMDISPFLQDQDFIREISNDEVKYVEETLATFLDTVTLDTNLDTLFKCYEEYSKVKNPLDKRKYLEVLKSRFKDMNTEFRKNNTSGYDSSNVFRLSALEDSAEDIHHYISDPSFMLVTGMQGMNGFLGGGFQKDRLYCFFGMSGEGKTVTMVNLLYQTWKYNKGFKTNDPTKKPVLILLTMENLVIEYVCSLFHVITHGKNIKNCSSAEEVIQEFRDRKFEYSEEGDIELYIEFQPVFAKDTSYLYEMTERLADEGFECIGFFMDYIMRIKPIDYTHDAYTDLGNVANDFKNYSMYYHVPFITCSQLNRDAAKIIDEGRSRNQNDIIRKLGRCNIGDSVNIDRNIDCSIILVPEVSATGIRYMSFMLTKHRYEIFTNKLVIFQPMYEGSYIAMVEDIYDHVPAFKETLARDTEDIREAFGDVERVSINNTIKSLTEMSSSKDMMTPGIMTTPKAIAPPKPEEDIKVEMPVARLVNKLEIVTVIPPEKREEMRKVLFPDYEKLHA